MKETYLKGLRHEIEFNFLTKINRWNNVYWFIFIFMGSMTSICICNFSCRSGENTQDKLYMEVSSNSLC
jgi:hypothetical protein